jgi:hypothetical protein
LRPDDTTLSSPVSAVRAAIEGQRCVARIFERPGSQTRLRCTKDLGHVLQLERM